MCYFFSSSRCNSRDYCINHAVLKLMSCLHCAMQAAYTIPILAFAFVCHPEVLPIYTELKKYVIYGSQT